MPLTDLRKLGRERCIPLSCGFWRFISCLGNFFIFFTRPLYPGVPEERLRLTTSEDGKTTTAKVFSWIFSRHINQEYDRSVGLNKAMVLTARIKRSGGHSEGYLRNRGWMCGHPAITHYYTWAVLETKYVVGEYIVLPIKEKVYGNRVGRLKVEGYPSKWWGSWSQGSWYEYQKPGHFAHHLVLPRFRWVIGRNLRLSREKDAVSVDLGTGGMEESSSWVGCLWVVRGSCWEWGPRKVPLERQGNGASSRWAAAGEWWALLYDRAFQMTEELGIFS